MLTNKPVVFIAATSLHYKINKKSDNFNGIMPYISHHISQYG